MADSANVRTVWAEDIVYNTFAATLFLQTFYQGWQSLFDNARTARLPVLDSNITVDYPADADALAQAPAFSTAELVGYEWSRELVRATKQVNLRKTAEAGGGSMLDAQANMELAVEMGIGVDQKFLGKIAGLNYVEVTNANVTGAGNLVEAGDANTLSRSLPYRPASVAAENAILESFETLANVLGLKHLVPGQGQFTGSQQPGVAVYHGSIPVVNMLVRRLADEKVLQSPSDIGAQALIDQRLPGGMVAYKGRAYGTDICANPAIRPPTAGDWHNYVYPANSTLVGGFSVLGISDSTFADGNTGGRYVNERTSIGIYQFGAPRPNHVIRHTIKGAV